MTDNKNDEQILEVEEEKTRKDSGSPLLQNVFYAPLTAEPVITPGFEIEYVPHKAQGLQSPSDMWIDKSRLFAGLSQDKMDMERIKRLSRQ